MKPSSLRNVLALIFGLLMNQLHAAITIGPENLAPACRKRIETAIADCITLATLVSVAVVDCDETFLRYFKRDEADFVRNLFRRIANFEPDEDLNPDNFIAYLERRNERGLGSKLKEITYWYGNHPQGIKQLCGTSEVGTDSGETAAFLTATRDTGVILICICDYAFSQCPDINEIYAPPAWARDGQGNPFPGFGCDGLLDRDTAYQYFLGALVLHEIMHHPTLFSDIPNFDNYIYHVKRDGGMKQIIDYFGINPIDGYGPPNTYTLNDQSLIAPQNFEGGHHASVNNADSYAVFAVSKFWQWKCKKKFDRSWSAEDANLRARQPDHRPPMGPALLPPPARRNGMDSLKSNLPVDGDS